MLLTAPWETLN